MQEGEIMTLEVILAILLLIGEIRVVSLLLNRETGAFYLIVGSELLRWEELSELDKQKTSVPIPGETEVQALGVILALLLLTGEVQVASLLLNREVGLFYYGIGGELFHWKESAPQL
jgi:hypothetical protein